MENFIFRAVLVFRKSQLLTHICQYDFSSMEALIWLPPNLKCALAHCQNNFFRNNIEDRKKTCDFIYILAYLEGCNTTLNFSVVAELF